MTAYDGISRDMMGYDDGDLKLGVVFTKTYQLMKIQWDTTNRMMWVGPEKVGFGSLQFIMKSLENDYWPVELGIRCSTGLLCFCAKQRLSNKDWSIWSGCGCKLHGGGTVGSKETPASHETTKCLHTYGVS